MKNQLKVGQQFEVVEVLADGRYCDAFKVGGCTISEPKQNGWYNTLTNFDSETNYTLNMKVEEEVKPVGRLTVVKVK